MNVIAQEGSWYLVDVGNGLGRVLDLEFGRFFPPASLSSLLATGSWRPFDGDQDAVIAAIADAPKRRPASSTRPQPEATLPSARDPTAAMAVPDARCHRLSSRSSISCTAARKAGRDARVASWTTKPGG